MPDAPPTTQSGPAIKTSGLTKKFGGSHAVRDLDLRVDVGEIFGFLGPLSAGKTTTIRLLLDLEYPTAERLGYSDSTPTATAWSFVTMSDTRRASYP